MMKKIVSRDNTHIKQAAKLKNKKYRQQQKLYLIEGQRLVNEALMSNQVVEKVFVAEDFSISDEMNRRLQNFDCYLIPPALFSSITDTENPQGIAAIVQKPEPDRDILADNITCLLLLDQITDPGNMGTIIRTAWAFNFDGIMLTPGCVDPYNPKVVRATMGGIFHLPVYEIHEQVLDGLIRSGYRLIGSYPDACNSIYEVDYTGPIVVVIGSEAQGISPAISERCKVKAFIPVNSRVESLNAAVSCAIIMSEANRQRQRETLSCDQSCAIIRLD